MIPKRSRQRVTPVLRFVECGQVGLERHHYSLGVDDPEAPPSAKTGRLPVTNQERDAPLRGAMPGMKLGAGRGLRSVCRGFAGWGWAEGACWG